MPRIDYQELKALSEEVTKLRIETVGYLKEYDQSNDAFTEDRDLLGASWSSGKRHHAQYKVISTAIFNALYDLDDSLKGYLAQFKSIVGEAENRLDTDELQELENELRRLQTQKLEFMEAMAEIFKDVPVLKEFFGNNTMAGQVKEIEILKRYDYFEGTTQGTFDGVEETVQAILEGLSYLGQQKNFESGASGYQVTDLSTSSWYNHLTNYNQANQEDRYEIREIKTKYGTVYQVLKNGKVQKKASADLQKSKVMETVGMMAELTPELIKILVGIDDIEVLMDDGSTTLQKSEAGIWILLSVLPPDKIKDVLKSAKLAKHSNKSFDSIRLTEKQWDKLKALDKSTDAVKVKKEGKIIVKSGQSIADLKHTENFSDKALHHVFAGELNKKGKATGYHYDGIEDTVGKIVKGTESKPNKFGVYEAKVEVNGIPKTANGGKSTFFPDDWESQKVVDVINEAFSNKQFVKNTVNTYEGIAENGMKISFFINKNGKIISAFPIL